jgi:predicted MFS family arabinose efflux permease
MSDPTPEKASSSPPPGETSSFAPFHYPAFTVLWVATVVSNIGIWMQNAAAGWLMTSLDPDPLIVSLVQVATAVPMFLFALPAGALADIVDRRKLLVVVQVVVSALLAVLAFLVWAERATPAILLLFTFLGAIGSALIAPAWQSIVPQLVPRPQLPPAVALNSVGLNVSRAVGPALAGVIIAAWGIAAPFWLNAVSNVGIIAALLWWHPAVQASRHLPVEHLGSAVRTGLRYARNNPHLRAILFRGAAFFLFASAYWALLPLVARSQIAGGPGLFGFMLGAIGAGAVGGAFALPWLKSRLGPDRLVAAATLGTAVAMAMYAVARDPATGLAASVIAGVSWIAALSSLNVSAQMALPEWVRGRGLAMFVTVFFGALSLGSALWGQAAGLAGLPAALLIAAAGAVVAIPLTWRWKLQTGADIDFSPSMHWQAPVVAQDVEHDRGPVLIVVEYRIDPGQRQPFLTALDKLGQERRRDGAYAWGVFEDAAAPGRMVETFLVESWLEHLRQHERVTNADRIVQDAVHRFHVEGTPTVTHLIAAAS